MNLPDVTLLLQIANFTIAYVVMRALIFAPALKILEQQDLYKKSLRQSIEVAKTEQHNVILQQKTSWQRAQQSLYALIPKLSRICVTNVSASEFASKESITLSSDEKKVLVEKLCDQLSDVKL
jgi:gas vesicle protein